MYQTPQTAFANHAGPGNFDRRAQPVPTAATAPPPQEHTDVIHDTQFDYYGKMLATASSDRTVGIYVAQQNGEKEQPALSRIATLSGHEGPVWMVSWAHPRFGTLLASASNDQKCFIWKKPQTEPQQWRIVHVIDTHAGSVNAVTWAPQEMGPMVATAGSDGVVAVTSYANGAWQESVKLSNNANQIAHAIAATCVSFAPLRTSMRDVTVLASGGCDCQVRLWVARHAVNGAFEHLQSLDIHKDWVRDVAFCPVSPATPHLLLASCGQDRTVVLQRKSWDQFASEVEQGGGDGHALTQWERSTVSFEQPVWRLSWAPCGRLLIVTTADARVFVVRQGNDFTEPWLKVPLSEYQA